MGIVNLTPDSFYAGSRFNADSVLTRVEQMLADGADFIDVGGYSSRPGADDISLDEELKRVIPVVKAIQKIFPQAILSIDTFRAEVARQGIAEGASMVNDISAGLLDIKMMEVVANAQVPYIMMHMRGTPQTMHQHTDYQNLVKEVVDYFHERIYRAHQVGIKDVIIDPGFGFAKTVSQNFELLKTLERLQVLEHPVLAGLSRKSLIWKTLQVKPEDALNGTSILNTMALKNGVNILRVHDVKEAVECCKLMKPLL
jgi:dihydropteroate synthase